MQKPCPFLGTTAALVAVVVVVAVVAIGVTGTCKNWASVVSFTGVATGIEFWNKKNLSKWDTRYVIVFLLDSKEEFFKGVHELK